MAKNEELAPQPLQEKLTGEELVVDYFFNRLDKAHIDRDRDRRELDDLGIRAVSSVVSVNGIPITPPTPGQQGLAVV